MQGARYRGNPDGYSGGDTFCKIIRLAFDVIALTISKAPLQNCESGLAREEGVSATFLFLTYRFREQARSHKGLAQKVTD
jgi:hypothetical protein